MRTLIKMQQTIKNFKFYIMKIKITLLSIALGFLMQNNFAQSVGINTDHSLPNPNAMLDIKSGNKGMLIPRMDSVARKNIPNTKGLMVYDTTFNSFWYNNGSIWLNLALVSGSGWNLNGNNGTTDDIQFIGTSDNIPLTIKVNGTRAGRIDHLLFNSFYGYQAGLSNTTGTFNTASGYQSLKNNTGSFNTAYGGNALLNNTTGIFNTAVGVNALTSNTTASNNTAVGLNTMSNNTTGDLNAAIGASALSLNTTGSSNTAIGFKALEANTTGNFNTAGGAKALINNTNGALNTAFGAQALISNTTGFNNTATGTNALFSNTTGFWSVANGEGALQNNTTGVRNTAIGEASLQNNSIGNDNSALGVQSLLFNTTGNGNVAIGTQALIWNSTGSENIAIGDRAGVSSGNGNLTNATAIGANSTVDCSNCMVLGTSGFFNPVNVGIGTSSPAFLLDVAGRMRIRSGTGINTAGTWFNNNANTNVAAFTGMFSDSYVGLYGTGSGWGFLMNTQDGRVAIGTDAPANGYKLSVFGKAICEELVVQLKAAWPDYVFKKNYQLRPLGELEKFISENKHLPNFPAAADIEKNGLQVGDMQKKMMEKIEELTLYIIEANKKIEKLELTIKQSK
jgi:trimeric autotransporter adhesin